jgi:hypothetical protein
MNFWGLASEIFAVFSLTFVIEADEKFEIKPVKNVILPTPEF